MKRAAALIAALAYASAIEPAAHGAQVEIEDFLERDWYYVETLFFRHRSPPDDEDFSRQPPPRHRSGIAALEPPPPSYIERMAALPEEPLDFPRLEQFDCIAPTQVPWMESIEVAPPPADSESVQDEDESLPAEQEVIPDDQEATPDAQAVPGEAQAVAGEPAADASDEEESETPQPIVSFAPVPTGPPAPTPEERAHWAFEEFERGLVLDGWRWRYDNLSLRSAATRMRRSDDYDVLHHGGWLQAVPPRDSARPLLIQLGGPMPDATFELEGSVSVTLGRFLHFAAQVWLRQDPIETLPELEAESTGGMEAVSADADGSDTDGSGYVMLSESRRMRPGEVHYLDHPWLGILVRIEEVEPPEPLLELAESLADG